jgi:ribose transport system substrate-binding protein
MKSYRIFTILTLFVLVFAMVACTTQTATPAQQQEQTTEKKVVIGFSQVTLDSPFYVELMKAAQAEAEKNGAELVYLDAQNNIEKQIKDIQDLITRGVDVMILNAVNPESIAPAVEALNKANIPIVTVDRPITPKVASFVGRDNFEMGRLSGEYAAKLLNGKGKVIEIQGAAGDKVMMARRDGFHSVIDKYPDIQVIQSPYSDYVRSKAVTAFQDMIQANPDVNLVYAHNDDMALGAVQVLESQKITGVKVVGVDCLMEAVKAIKDGRYDSTTANDPQYLGTVAVQVALKVLKGEKVGEYIDTGTTLITKDNVDQYVGNTGTFCTYTPEIKW